MSDLIIIIVLIILNGVFSMSEVALISARKAKLATSARNGSRSAATALKLQDEPDRFLSTVQIGITLIGILTGLYSGATIATELGRYLASAGIPAKFAMGISKTLIIASVTYLSIVIGELVPKRIGLGNADVIAKIVAGPMRLLSYVTFPAVWVLSVSTSFIVRILHIGDNRNKVTEEEIKSMIQEGTEAGEVREVEQDIMERALVMGDSRIEAIMTPRKEVTFLSSDMKIEEILKILAENLYSTYPVFCHNKEDICGVVSLKKLIPAIADTGFDIGSQVSPGLSLPETMTVYDALETFRKTGEHSALVYDEYGGFQGIVTIRDILEGLVGNISDENGKPMILKRKGHDDWLVEGQCPVYDFLAYFDREDLYSPSAYTTVGGLVIELIRKVPAQGECVKWHCFNLEVIKMDNARIDKICVSVDPEPTS